ncbi:MAG: ATP-binding protein [Bacteroidetes bacterium]|nr:ATP-binding protein [Bacteroidota bacterium]
MYREAYKRLKDWKETDGRKPLIVRGARQVGKTWLLKEFARTRYKNSLYVNFEDDTQLQSLFIEDFDLERIISVLEIYTSETVYPGNTLIILDEIQVAERGITSLKYFFEKAPGIHVIAAGSLLGISMPKKSSFPVGKVDFLDLNPMTFSEFLLAKGEKELIELLKRKDWSSISFFRSKLTEYLKTYYYVGGMPEVVYAYSHNRDWKRVRSIQKSILIAYEADFSKHAPSNVLPRIRLVWQSLAAQLAKENKKFIYGSLKPGARAKDFELAIQWLVDAGLIYKACRVSKPELPLNAFEELSIFKLYMVDVGLLSAMCDLPLETMIQGNDLFLQYKGALTEQFIFQQLNASDSQKIAYWTNERSTTEVDFIVQREGRIIPIEVKAEVNVKARSFRFFCEKYKPQTALRFSMKDYKEESWMTNLPLYSVEYALSE